MKTTQQQLGLFNEPAGETWESMRDKGALFVRP